MKTSHTHEELHVARGSNSPARCPTPRQLWPTQYKLVRIGLATCSAPIRTNSIACETQPQIVSHDRMQSLQHCTSLHSARGRHAASDRNEVVVVVVRRFPLPRQEDFLRRQDGRHFTFNEWFSASECASLVESSSHKIQDQVSDSATFGLDDMDCARLLSLVSAPHARFSLWERLSF